jgi:hypothetical protein
MVYVRHTVYTVCNTVCTFWIYGLEHPYRCITDDVNMIHTDAHVVLFLVPIQVLLLWADYAPSSGILAVALGCCCHWIESFPWLGL